MQTCSFEDTVRFCTEPQCEGSGAIETCTQSAGCRARRDTSTRERADDQSAHRDALPGGSVGLDARLVGSGYCVKNRLSEIGIDWEDAPQVVGLDDLALFAQQQRCTIVVVTTCGESVAHVAPAGAYTKSSLVLTITPNLQHCVRAAQLSYSLLLGSAGLGVPQVTMNACFNKQDVRLAADVAEHPSETERQLATVAGIFNMLNEMTCPVDSAVVETDGYCVRDALLDIGIVWEDAPHTADVSALAKLAAQQHAVIALVTAEGESVAHIFRVDISTEKVIILTVTPDLTHCMSAATLPCLDACWEAGVTTRVIVNECYDADKIKLAGDASLPAAVQQRRKGKAKKLLSEFELDERRIERARKRTNATFKRLDKRAQKYETDADENVRSMAKELREATSALQDATEKLRAAKSSYAANTFAANNFSAAPLPSELSALLDRVHVPASNSHEAAEIIMNVVDGLAYPPKRFGDDSVMKVVQCNGILSLSGLTPGNTVFVLTPINSADKGALVFQNTPTGVSPSVIGYIAPDRDLEKFSTRSAVSYAELTISAPLVIGGSSVNVGQMTVESGICQVSPLQAFSGKLAPLCQGRYAPQRIMGSTPVTVANFTATQRAEDLIRVSSTDIQDPNLVRIPGVANQQAVGCMIPTHARRVRFAAAPQVSSTAAQAAGFDANLYNGGPGVDVPITPTIVWRLEDSTDYLRHMLFGHFTFNTMWRMSAPYLSAHPLKVVLRVTYSDGSTNTETTWTPVEAGEIGSATFCFNTRGATVWDEKSGLYITGMEIELQKGGADGTTGVYDMYVDIIFEDVAFDTQYLAHVVTGAVPQANLNAALKVYAEVFPDPTTQTGKEIEPTKDLPYTTGHFPDLVRLLQIKHDVAWSGHTGLYQAGFFKTLKDISKFSRKHWRPLAKATTDVLSAIPQTRSFGTAARGFIDSVPATPGEYRARAFGTGEHVSRGTGVFFPAYKTEPEPTTRDFEITSGGKAGPVWTKMITESRLGSYGPWEGESADLAFLVAAMKDAGWPLLGDTHSPLLLSGDIEQLKVYGPDSISFQLLPVKGVQTKAASPIKRQFLVSPEGVWIDGVMPSEPSVMPLRHFVAPAVNVEAIYHPPSTEPSTQVKNALNGYWEVSMSK